MDYIETFKANCRNEFTNRDVTFSKSPSATQRRYEFEQGLKLRTQELERHFTDQVENWSDLASKHGQIGIKPNLINEIRNLLREFKDSQMDRFESNEGK
jgi:hypothetical protein